MSTVLRRLARVGRARWLIACAVVALSDVFSGCASARSASSSAPAPRPDELVAEGIVRAADNSVLRYVYLPVTVHGQSAMVLLDHGTTQSFLSRQALAALGVMARDRLDSLRIGPVLERDIEVGGGHFAAPGPDFPPYIGLLGTPVLSHYNFLLDGPARRVYLYRPAGGTPTGEHTAMPTSRGTTRQVGWLPQGFTPADCAPLAPDPQGADRVFLPIAVNGQPIHSMFDSGSDFTNVNLAAAGVLGITKRTPGIRQLPPDSAPQFPVYQGQKVWEVPAVTLTVGNRQLPPTPLHIYQALPRQASPVDPELSLGLASVLGVRMYISYSSGYVCFSEARPSNAK